MLIPVQTNTDKGTHRRCMGGTRKNPQSVSHFPLLTGFNIYRTAGMMAIYRGYMTTHPGILAVLIIWDTIHSHHKLEHSPSYGPFVAGVKPFLAAPIQIQHFEITEPKQLKQAIESPVTQISHLHVTGGQVAPFLKGYHDGLEKYIKGEKYKGITLMYPYEDVYALLAWTGGLI